MMWLALTYTLMLEVKAPSPISNAVVRRTLDETAEIWRSAGVALKSNLTNGADGSADPFADSSMHSSMDPPVVRVVFDEQRGIQSDYEMPFGWIVFDASGAPEPVVHLSYRNVLRMIEASAKYKEAPTIEQEILLGRALGRALAHELGHYVLASKDHAQAGLMRGRRSTDDFFSPSRAAFTIRSRDRERLAARLRADVAHTARAGTAHPRGPDAADSHRDLDEGCPPIHHERDGSPPG